MKQLVLMVGVPGAGKTTVAKQLLERGYYYLNADDIRKELWGDSGDQREPEKVFELFYKRLEDALAEGLDIVIDNTNINTRHRQPIISRAIAAGYTDIQLWILDVPLEVCLERNRARDRSVPDDIVVNYFNTLHGHGKPKKHEGKLVIVRPGKQDFQFRFFALK